jgi:hypothetical protein
MYYFPTPTETRKVAGEGEMAFRLQGDFGLGLRPNKPFIICSLSANLQRKFRTY